MSNINTSFNNFRTDNFVMLDKTKAKEKRSIIARITNQQKLWIGHNLRHPDNLLTLAIEGRFIGKRGQGRKRCTFLDLKSGEDYGSYIEEKSGR